MNGIPFTPLTRAQLQAEAVDGHKRAQIQQLIEQHYRPIVKAAKDGQKEYFFQCPMKVGLNIKNGMISHTSNTEFITHDDIIQELTKLFPGVTITSIQQKGTPQMVYQHSGILLDWS